MPELPDITVYLEALEERIAGRALTRVDILTPFLLRSVDPPPSAAIGRRVVAFRRLGKRIAIGFEGDLWFVLHLMIAGRLHWQAEGEQGARRQARPRGDARKPVRGAGFGRNALAVLGFDNGLLVLTEAGTQKRAALHVVAGEEALAAHRPPGIEIAEATPAEFAAALKRENHTLKRALTDPRIFSGIGNAYSDEILHRARLSPVALTSRLTEQECTRLLAATRQVLEEWTARLRDERAGGFPEKVTAFRPQMAVHGKYGEPCPVCGTKVQRVRYAANETNYCPRCQTGGRLLADRALSRLLKSDWPRCIDELERQQGARP